MEYAPFAAEDRRRFIPLLPTLSSVALGCEGLEVEEYSDKPDGHVAYPALNRHLLVLHLTDRSNYLLEANGQTRRWRPAPGGVSFLPAGTPCRWEWTGRPQTGVFILQPDLVATAAVECAVALTDSVVGPSPDLGDPAISATLQAIRSEVAAGGSGARACLEALSRVLAIQLVRHAIATPLGPVEPLPDDAQERLRLVQGFVEANLASDLSLADLAEVAGMSPFHFGRVFKRATGMTPHRYVIARRVERAKALLRRADGERSLTAVALAVGFADQSHFNRVFKDLVGVSPGRFA